MPGDFGPFQHGTLARQRYEESRSVGVGSREQRYVRQKIEVTYGQSYILDSKNQKRPRSPRSGSH